MNQKDRSTHFQWVLALAKSGLVFLMVLGAAGCRTQLPEVTPSEFSQRTVGIVAVGLSPTTAEPLIP
ncbi:hypothetical protein Nhal_1291 [Nitrosococcus halophilus Nc 4]|uniref:Lipoprotein n=1 Tax=Nitrosococcus halophilus (strain Nc4) TaxID=472759 RepID=D5C0B7_NITHN|nr:hypothetical protein [Nitrosococcus halophilus]ADE14443.1 hypothetical protein Nhal_1291 [Nitrosococcus halophilus Nc 4]